MTPHPFDPRRLKDIPSRSRSVAHSVDRRLARQLALLAAEVPPSLLGGASRGAPRRRLSLMVARLVIVSVSLLVIGGAASAAVAYLVADWRPPFAVLRAPRTAPDARRPAPLRLAGRRTDGPAKERPASEGVDAAAPAVPAPWVHDGGRATAGRTVAMSGDTQARTSLPATTTKTTAPTATTGGGRVDPARDERSAPPPSPPPRADHLAGVGEPISLASAPAPTRSTRPAAEAELLRQALRALRQTADPRRAMAILDAYDAAFPRGSLAAEASAVRVRALLQAGDRAAALAILDREALDRDGSGDDLWVTRGELRSLAGRCPEAIADFDVVLRRSSSGDAEARARALFGRASCRARAGDRAGADQDRERYLSEFPEGPAVNQLRHDP